MLPSGGVHFRVWASRRQHVEVVLEGGPGHHPGAEPISVALEPEGDGYFSALIPEASAGTLYRYRLDGGAESYPDVASRFQPHGPHGPSQVVDPGAFQWHDQSWRGVSLEGQVIYEMHVGTFTPAGTWEAAMGELPALAELGVTVLEIMPIADFSGRFGWGYDGVNLFAPTRLYGTPDDCRRFIERAHTLGLGVILDVVYNHLGADGNFLAQFSPEYFTDRYTTDWGQAINYADEHAGPVREFFIANAGYWIEEFHFDGLRLDATQNIYDTSAEHILAAIARAYATRPMDVPLFSWPRTNRSTRNWSAYPSMADMALTRSGMMTSITVQWWRSLGVVQPITVTTGGRRKNLFPPSSGGISIRDNTIRGSSSGVVPPPSISTGSVCDLSAEP